ncbi:hypothetical protein [Thermogemmatispora sp.]|jgi:hypothetical protein|uniref:hypothetical protein n=1 Tax=Thermogemmatispora sp. TaxID=1968838 RepID=UPI0035E45A45
MKATTKQPKGPISLRNVPPVALQLAQALAEQTHLSLADLLRQALVTGLLVEATRFAPDAQGRLGGMEAIALARALRRHLGSAIDLLIEHGELPYGTSAAQRPEGERARQGKASALNHWELQQPQMAPALGEDLEQLGIGVSLVNFLEQPPPGTA